MCSNNDNFSYEERRILVTGAGALSSRASDRGDKAMCDVKCDWNRDRHGDRHDDKHDDRHDDRYDESNVR